MTTSPRQVAPFLPLVLAACGAGENPVTRFTADTLASGTIVVTNTGQPAWTEGTEWRVEEDLRLGVMDGGGPEQFGQIAFLQTDEDGNIYVLDHQAQEVRVFDEEGAHLRTIGREGGGPGELRGASGLNWGPDGNLWVWETGNRRFSVFRPDGSHVTTHPREATGVIFPWRGEFSPDGLMVDWGLDHPDRPRPDRPDFVPTGDSWRAVFHPIRISADFAAHDTLPAVQYEMPMADVRVGRGRPFSPRLVTYLDRRGGIWFASSHEYRIHRRSLDGDTTLIFTLPVDPPAVTQAQIDSVVEARRDAPEQFRSSPDEVWPTRPLIRRMISDNAGLLYVFFETDELALGDAVDVFRDSGEYLGRMELPGRMSYPYPPPHATENALYLVVTDEYDVEYVTRLRIGRGDG